MRDEVTGEMGALGRVSVTETRVPVKDILRKIA